MKTKSKGDGKSTLKTEAVKNVTGNSDVKKDAGGKKSK